MNKEKSILSKVDWLILLGLVSLVCFLDQASKSWALAQVNTPYFNNFLSFSLQINPGLILGSFSEMPAMLRVVSISTTGAFVIFIYAFIQYLLPHRLMTLRIGLSILLGGILSNVLDRIKWGSVIDFISLDILKWKSLVFNLADAFQWFGYAFIIFSVIKNSEKLWPSSNNRKKIWINKSFQLRYILTFLIAGGGFAIISGVFSYTYLKIIIDENALRAPSSEINNYLSSFILSYTILSFFFMFALLIIGEKLSHRIAGPIYSFERFLTEALNGSRKSFKTRAGDEFKQLEELSKKIDEFLNKERT